ncbi:hypothetical protein H5410_059262 [Solanum commersonii]|uniref:Uncharacterized protein n=1 Tax=Solanum commersonii TaxID=4109 RepID=A0A9J5W2D1_SOLCO|nr:hypothetical protein H5410_059262 [Solanum commersonii]
MIPKRQQLQRPQIHRKQLTASMVRLSGFYSSRANNFKPTTYRLKFYPRPRFRSRSKSVKIQVGGEIQVFGSRRYTKRAYTHADIHRYTTDVYQKRD